MSVVVSLIEPVPMKSVKERWEKLDTSRIIKPRLSSNSLTELLRDSGSDLYDQYDSF